MHNLSVPRGSFSWLFLYLHLKLCGPLGKSWFLPALRQSNSVGWHTVDCCGVSLFHFSSMMGSLTGSLFPFCHWHMQLGWAGWTWSGTSIFQIQLQACKPCSSWVIQAWCSHSLWHSWNTLKGLSCCQAVLVSHALPWQQPLQMFHKAHHGRREDRCGQRGQCQSALGLPTAQMTARSHQQ